MSARYADRIVAAVFVALASFPVAAEEVLNGPVQAELIRVIDGDTIEVRARLWLGLYLVTRVRLSGIDAPELDSACERERDLARAARRLLDDTLTPRLRLMEIHQDKYGGRVVARVASATTEDVGRMLLAADLARPYGAHAPWCE